MEQLKTLSDYNDGDQLLVGRPDHNGDFRWFPVVDVLDMRNHLPDSELADLGYIYHVTLQVVSPEAAGQENIDRALDCIGMREDEIAAQGAAKELVIVEALADYGVSAPVWQTSGSNLRLLLKEGRHQLALLRTLFGWYMDRACNRLGSTGWDFVRGDLDGALNRRVEAGATTQMDRIILKMEGRI